MRLIGHLTTEAAARTFGDFLFVQGIENRIEDHANDGWAVWVNDEDKLEGAAQLLTTFRANPADPQFTKQARRAADLRAGQEKDQEAYRKRLRDRRHLFRPLTAYGFGALTFALIVASVAVFIRSGYSEQLNRIMDLFITNWGVGGVYPLDTTLPEIRHGQIWRLFTPIFIHFGITHIFFNMLWLRDLGSMIEGRQSTGHLAVLVLVIAACSNVAQYYIGGSPVFGGMSGVVYGLLGYIWIRGKFDPGSGLYLHSSTVIMMLIWFVLCFTKLFGPIANTAHAVGLGMGVAWGWASSLRYR